MPTLSERDRALIWHPLTQEKTADLPIPIQRGEGAYVYDDQGHAYLDLISSWWVNLHGHAHPLIAKALYEQAQTLEHVIFAGFTHRPAVELCEQLSEILPPSLQRFFFSDNGSTSTEIALKMAYQYWYNQGHPERSLFLSLEGGYHGDTFGAMAVGAQSGFHHTFQRFLFQTLTIPYPHTWDQDGDVAHKEHQALEILDQHLKQHGDRIAGVILEPLIQGASGMRMCRPAFINQLIERVRAQGILVIFDEVMTGFGRTGRFFALDHLHHTPDILCLSKGLTGGFLPLALTVTTSPIFQAFWGDVWDQALIHGHSYTANPLACAVALASLKLLRQPSTQHALQNLHNGHLQGLQSLQAQGAPIHRTRVCGTIAAFDVVSPRAAADLQKHLRRTFVEKHLLLRPLGSTVYLLPPYVVTPEALTQAYHTIGETLEDLSRAS